MQLSHMPLGLDHFVEKNQDSICTSVITDSLARNECILDLICTLNLNVSELYVHTYNRSKMLVHPELTLV